jgi:hypothetical protein
VGTRSLSGYAAHCSSVQLIKRVILPGCPDLRWLYTMPIDCSKHSFFQTASANIFNCCFQATSSSYCCKNQRGRAKRCLSCMLRDWMVPKPYLPREILATLSGKYSVYMFGGVLERYAFYCVLQGLYSCGAKQSPASKKCQDVPGTCYVTSTSHVLVLHGFTTEPPSLALRAIKVPSPACDSFPISPKIPQ